MSLSLLTLEPDDDDDDGKTTKNFQQLEREQYSLSVY